MNETDCRVCHREGIMSARGLCPPCEELVEIVRKNLEGAAKSKLKPPKRRPKCSDCGVAMKPVLFRPEGPWTFYCVMGCYGCPRPNRHANHSSSAPNGIHHGEEPWEVEKWEMTTRQ